MGIVIYPPHTARVRNPRLVILNAADLRAVDKSRVFLHFSGGILRGTVGAHAEIGIGQRVGRLVNNRAAITAAFPQLYFPLTA